MDFVTEEKLPKSDFLTLTALSQIHAQEGKGSMHKIPTEAKFPHLCLPLLEDSQAY